MTDSIDAFKLDYWEMRKIAGSILKKDWIAMIRQQQKIKWEKFKKLDLMLSK